MDASYIITFIGDDRPGLVEQLSSTIENSQGNWLESRLSQLGGKFTGLILVSLPADSADGLEAELKGLASSGLSVRVTPAAGAVTSAAEGKTIVLTVLGPDRLGIVKEISRALAGHNINVVEMDSHVDSAAMSGEMLFHARIEAQVPTDTDIDNLHASLDEIANHMTLEIDLE